MAWERSLCTCELPSSPKAARTGGTAIITNMIMVGAIMSDEQCRLPAPAFLRLQSWLSPAFPTGSYSYSHGLEWAVEAGHIHDRRSLVDWLEADLCYGSGRNEAIFFLEAWRCAVADDRAKLLEIAEMAGGPRRPTGISPRTAPEGDSLPAHAAPAMARAHPPRPPRGPLAT